MNTVLSRLNAFFAFTLSVLAGLTFLCFLSTIMNDNQALATIQTPKVIVKHMVDYSLSREKRDLGQVTFDLSADLTPIFNWNVKQLFVYLTAEYETKDFGLNQIVLWDKIIKRGENANLNYRNKNTKYYFWDDGAGLKGNSNVTIYLSWNCIPNAGVLPNIIGHGRHSFAFPDAYVGKM